MTKTTPWSPCIVSLVLGLTVGASCARPAETAASAREGDVPPSGLYRAAPVTMKDTCATTATVTSEDTSARERRAPFFVTMSARDGAVHGNLPLVFDGLPWEELASRATIDFARAMAIVDAPATRCPDARRRREARVTAAAADGFDLDVTERWSIPDSSDCELPASAPRASCERLVHVALHLEKACDSEPEIALQACVQRPR